MTTISTDLLERSRSISPLSSIEFRHQLSQLVTDSVETFNTTQTSKRFLNSIQLPQEVTDFCTDNNFPTEVLKFIVELQKSSDGTSKERNNYLDIGRKLLDFWIESNSCAQAFLRFSLHQSNSSETANFNRILFSIADTFHLNRREFPRFIFEQVLLVTSALIESIKRGEEHDIRTGFLSSVIDRAFLRLHADSENFYAHFDSEDELAVEIKDPFLQFVINAGEQCRENFIARRLLGKILLGLGQGTVSKIGKTIFLADTYSKFNPSISPASKLLLPPEEFLHKNLVWKHTLFSSLPLKTRLENFDFFTSWAKFVWTESILLLNDHKEIDNIWKICCDNWSLIIHNSCADQKSMVSATYALVALLKCVKKSNSKTQVEQLFGSITAEVTKILQCITKCLDSTDTNKQACGMAVGQIVCDLIEENRKKCDDSKKPPPPTQSFGFNDAGDSPLSPGTGSDPKADGNSNTRLKFESTNPLFLKLVDFYEDKMVGKVTKAIENLKIVAPQNFGKFELLDSDDEEEENMDKESVQESNEPCQFEPYDMSNDTPVDESLYNLKNQGKKIPVYFSDICEVLFEAHGSKDEATMERLKQIAVLRIPLLLFHKIKIDSSTGQKLARMLAEIESGGILEIPIICGLYELASLHPTEVFQTLAEIAFDKDHFSMGHRIVILSRYSEIIHLLTKQKCFSCFSEETGKLDKLLAKIHLPFLKDYLDKRRGARKCQVCFKATDREKNAATAAAVESSPSKHLVAAGSTTTTSSSATSLVSTSDKDLTWRQIVDERVASKTRRFASSKEGKFVETPDTYSSVLVPIIWAALANRLMSNAFLLRDNEATNKVSMAVFTAHTLRVLGWIVYGTSGIFCPHLRNIATQAYDLIKLFYNHEDPHVRRSVVSLLSIITTSAEGKYFVMEIFTRHDNLFEQLKPVFQHDSDPENRFLFNNLMKFVAAAAAVEMGNCLN